MKILSTVVPLIIAGLCCSSAKPNHNEFESRNSSLTSSIEQTPSSSMKEQSADKQTETKMFVKDLPEVGDDFQNLRKNNKTYVDKTPFLAKLLDHFLYSQKRNYIMMRPPQFGKTTFLDMMASFFRGEKHLFEGTSIYERGNTDEKNGTWIEHPVIYLNFGKMLDDCLAANTSQYFRFFYRQQINDVAKKYNVHPEGAFFILIRALAKKFNLPVVVLGDEYDRPIDYALHVLQNITLAEHMQNVARGFLYNIIDETSKIKLAFVVGVVKLKVDQESVPQFYDITHHREFASIMGFSHQEIDTYFQPFVRKFAENRNRTPEDIMNEIIKRYDGYRFASDDNMTRVFNPVPVIEGLRKADLAGNHWSSNRSLEHIIRTFIKQNLTVENFKNCSIPREVLYNPNAYAYPLENPGVPIHLYMLLHGYLTIKVYDVMEDVATLGYANDQKDGEKLMMYLGRCVTPTNVTTTRSLNPGRLLFFKEIMIREIGEKFYMDRFMS